MTRIKFDETYIFRMSMKFDSFDVSFSIKIPFFRVSLLLSRVAPYYSSCLKNRTFLSLQIRAWKLDSKIFWIWWRDFDSDYVTLRWYFQFFEKRQIFSGSLPLMGKTTRLKKLLWWEFHQTYPWGNVSSKGLCIRLLNKF